MSLFEKDPDETLDFQVDWSTWLGSDLISTSNFTPGAGITKTSQSNTTTAATVWLSGGTAGKVYQVTNTITTTGGRTAERTLEIRVRER